VQGGVESMNVTFDKGMANIEKCFKKFKDNLLYIRKEFVKQIDYYEQINDKMKLHHDTLLKLNYQQHSARESVKRAISSEILVLNVGGF
jgi:hypothetical protein